MFFGLLGLLFIKSGLTDKKVFIILPTLQLFSLISKETALLFIFIQAVYTSLFQRKYFVKQLLISMVVALIYFGWRYLNFGSITTHKFLVVVPNSPVASSFEERLINVPSVIFFYIKTFLFPKDLAVSQLWWNKTIELNNFYIPLIICFLALSILVSIGVYIYKIRPKDFKLYLLFCLWILSGIGLHSQIIPLDWTVAERWFYFTIIGFLGLTGVVLKGIEVRKENYKILIYSVGIAIIVILSTRTIIRNANWHDQLTLTDHDIKISKNSGDLELNYGIAFMEAGNYSDAIIHLTRASQLIPTGYTIWHSLGATYANAKNYDAAINNFNKAIEINPNYLQPYADISRVYLLDLKALEAKQYLENKALKKWPDEEYLWRLLGIANLILKENESALRAFEKAYFISPNEQNTYYYFQLKDGKEVQIRM